MAVAGRARSAPLDPAEAAWIVVVPCAFAVALAMLVLGAPLGDLLFPKPSIHFMVDATLLREPTEQARFVLALAGPLLLTAATAFAVRSRRVAAWPGAQSLVLVAQWAAAALVVLCFVVQRLTRYGAPFNDPRTPEDTVYFTGATLAAALAVAAATFAVTRRAGARALVTRATRDTRVRCVLAVAVAVAAIVTWFLTTVHLDRTTATLNQAVLRHLPFAMDETWAVLDGRTPLVDFVSQYGALWAYPFAAVLALVGPSTGAYTVVAAIVSCLAMLAVYATLWRVFRSALLALPLFLAVLATAGFMMEGPLEDRYAVTSLPSMFPLRYAGPLLLLWLTARHLDGARPRRAVVLFFAAGVVVLNNPEFGVPAAGATLAAILWSSTRLSRRGIARLGLECVAGLGLAYGCVALLLWLRSGSLPDVVGLFTFSRTLVLGGWATMPLRPVLGVALVMYLTYVAAIGVATVYALRGSNSALQIGALVWSGVFGLGTGAYYVGRSHPEVLTNLFGPWAICVVLLAGAGVRSYVGSGRRWPTPGEALCVVGFGIAACSVVQWPVPWTQVERLGGRSDSVRQPPFGERFVDDHTRPGERVAILLHQGHRIAYDLGLDNVSPFAGSQSIFTHEQLREVLSALRASGGTKLFAYVEDIGPDMKVQLASADFAIGPNLDYVIQFTAPWIGRNPAPTG